jgi:hypothetical protein
MIPRDAGEPHHSRFFTNMRFPRIASWVIASLTFLSRPMRFPRIECGVTTSYIGLSRLSWATAEPTEPPLAINLPPTFPFSAWRGIGLALGRGFPPSLG